MRKLLWILPLLFILTGCGYKDLDRRFFVSAIAVDQSDNPKKPYKVSLLLVVPSAKIEPGKEKKQIVSMEAENIAQAIHLLKSSVDKELEFGHTKVAIFGEAIARKDIQTTMDWFNRRRDIQRILYLAVGTPTAEDIIRVKPVSERFAGNALILSFAKTGTESSYISTEMLYDFTRRLEQDGLDPYMPVIDAEGKIYSIRKTFVFDKHKVKVALNPTESRLLNELMRNYSKVSFRVHYHSIDFMFNPDTLHMKYSIQTPVGKKPYIDIRVNIKGIAEESKAEITAQNRQEYEHATEVVLEKRYLSLLKKLRDNNVDPIGFGLHYQATHFHKGQDWQDWQKIYPNIDFHVQVKVHLNGSGIIK